MVFFGISLLGALRSFHNFCVFLLKSEKKLNQALKMCKRQCFFKGFLRKFSEISRYNLEAFGTCSLFLLLILLAIYINRNSYSLSGFSLEFSKVFETFLFLLTRTKIVPESFKL